MVIKNNKSHLFIYSVLIILIAFYFSFDRKVLTVAAHDVYSGFMSNDPGFSTARNLVDTGGNNKHQSIFLKLQSMASNAYEIILYKLRNNQHNDLKNIDISINFSNFKKILNDRSKAIKKDYLNEPSVVNATISYDGKSYKAKVRLKGDLGDHWLSKHRMSLRVSLKNGGTILGFNKFSIHKPRARQYPYEQAFQGTLRQGGNITAIHKYASISVNGEDWGVMSIEENISKEFLEKQRLKDSLVFRFSDDKKWLRYNKTVIDNFPYYRYSDSKLIATISKQRKHLKNELNRKRYTYVLEERLKTYHPKLYSVEPHMRAFFASLLWRNQHTLSDSNSRYYLNPYTLKLEPITTDQGMFSLITEELDKDLNRMYLTETYDQVLSSFSDYKNKNKYFVEVLGLFDNIEAKLNQYRKYFPLDAYKQDDILLQNMDLITKDKAILYKWLESYRINDEKVKGNPTNAQAKDFLDHLHVRHYDDGRLLIFNLLPDEVKVNRIVFGGNETEYENLIIPGYVANSYEPYLLQTNIKGIQDDQIIINSSYKNNKRSILAYPTLLSKGMSNPLIGSSISNTSFLIKKDVDSWEVIPGEWTIKSPMIINGSLRINEDTHLNFSRDSYLIVKGEIEFIGSKSRPIIFDSLGSGWKGIYVLSDKHNKSILHNVIFKDTIGLSDGLLSLSGGVSIYGGNVDIKEVSIEGSTAEDALNIINSSINISGLKIKNTISDAFDCDYCIGKIINSKFSYINGDAIDLSGSEVEIKNINASNVKDKGLSIGEASTVDIKDGVFSNIGVGVAVKDGSKASFVNMTIRNYDLYAAMTYSKKKHYDVFSSLKLKNCLLEGDNPYLRQVNTLLTVDGVEVEEREVDVKDLYSSGVMKK